MSTRMHMVWLVCLSAMVALLWGPAALGQDAAPLRAEPATLTFDTFDPVFHIKLFRGGAPLPASALAGYGVFIEDRTYDHMFHISRFGDAEGGLRVAANPEHLQIGTYDLRIRAGGGELTVPIAAPLDKLPTSLETQAERLGITVQDLRRRMALYTVPGRSVVDIALPPRYYVGDNLSLNLDDDPEKTYIWTVNGEVVQKGLGEGDLTYTFEKPGTYTLAVVERRGGATLAEWSGQTEVVEEPVIHTAIKPNRRVQFPKLEGYGSYSWHIDGQPVGNEAAFAHTFREEGTYSVVCIAREPEHAPWKAFRKIVWEVTVSRSAP